MQLMFETLGQCKQRHYQGDIFYSVIKWKTSHLHHDRIPIKATVGCKMDRCLSVQLLNTVNSQKTIVDWCWLDTFSQSSNTFELLRGKQACSTCEPRRFMQPSYETNKHVHVPYGHFCGWCPPSILLKQQIRCMDLNAAWDKPVQPTVIVIKSSNENMKTHYVAIAIIEPLSV